MKKNLSILVLFLAVTTLAFTGCKKDDDEKTHDIVGKWGAESYTGKIWVNGQLADENEGNYEANSYSAELKADNTFIVIQDGEQTTGTYRISGNKLITKDTGSNEEDEAEFSLSDGNKTLTVKFAEEGIAQGATFRYEHVDVFKRK